MGMNDLLEWVKEHPGMTWVLSLYAVFFVVLYSLPEMGEVLLVSPDEPLARPWTFLTVMFSNAMVLHLVLNGFLIVMIGARLEKAASLMTALGVFLVTGLLGSLSILVYAPLLSSTGDPVALSSAAALGMAGAYAAMKPEETILKSKAHRWVIILFIMNILLSFQHEVVTMMGPANAVGLITGWLIGYGLKKRLAQEPEPA